MVQFWQTSPPAWRGQRGGVIDNFKIRVVPECGVEAQPLRPNPGTIGGIPPLRANSPRFSLIRGYCAPEK